MWALSAISGWGTLNTNINTLGFSLFVKQEVELNIFEVPTGSKLVCVASEQPNPPICWGVHIWIGLHLMGM